MQPWPTYMAGKRCNGRTAHAVARAMAHALGQSGYAMVQAADNFPLTIGAHLAASIRGQACPPPARI